MGVSVYTDGRCTHDVESTSRMHIRLQTAQAHAGDGGRRVLVQDGMARASTFRQAGITRGCDPLDPAFFCPLRPLTRAEMASFFVRAMGL